METRVGSPPSVTISVSASEEMRASRRNSSVSNSPNSQGAGQFFGGSFEDPSSSFAASSNNGVGNHSLKSFNLRRSSSLADEEMTKMKNLTLKLIHVLTERAKLNPALKDPMRIPLVLESESGDITNILKAESQFAPMVNFNSEYTMLDAINEEVDCALMDAVDNYGHPTFLPEDEEVLYLFLREVSNKLHGTNGKSFSRRRGTKLASLIQMDAALLEAYTSLKTSIACAHITKVERNIHTYVPTLTPNFENDCAFHKWSFDPFVRTDTELMEVAFQMVSNFGLIEKFGIEKEKLRTLISIARKNYRPNAFHNFYHAMGVMHLSYQILRRGAAEYLTPLDILAVLLGALCHDLDHPGNNNAFEVASGSELANIYSDDAVLERYHIYMTHKIMRMSEADVLSKLSPSERVEFRATITAGVMATDMAKHFLLTEKLVQSSKTIPPFVVTDPASRQALVGFVIHCADIGAQTQKKELALKWGQRVLEEFQHQAALEEKLNIPTAPFMQGLDSELARMKLQQGFVAGIVIPLWSALADCLPRLHPCVERAEIMKDFYEEQVQILSVGVLASPRRSGTDVLLASSSSKSLR